MCLSIFKVWNDTKSVNWVGTEATEATQILGASFCTEGIMSLNNLSIHYVFLTSPQDGNRIREAYYQM